MIRRWLALYRALRSGVGGDADFVMSIDEFWYRDVYGELIPPGMSALEHYAAYGATLGCDPSAFFNTIDYLTRYPEVRKAGINPLWHYVSRGRADKAIITPSSAYSEEMFPPVLLRQAAKVLESKLWGGYSRVVLPVLNAKVVTPDVSVAQRSYAAWALARWWAFHQDYTRALHYLVQRRALDANAVHQKTQLLLEVDCLVRLGQEQEAYDRLLASRSAVGRSDADLWLLQSNVLVNSDSSDGCERRLTSINQVFGRNGLTGVTRLDESIPLTLSNLAATARQAGDSGDAKVSILMPAYNAGPQIELALASLLAQSWTNFEILVADDASTDDTRDRVRALAKSDDRIRLIALPENGGAYAARNAALREASGDFVTVHDSDDWSHPQKLECQVRYLLSHPEAVATLTDWARVREDLYFTGTFRAHGSLVSENTSSLMFRRHAVEALGEWDLARTSADSELVLRMRRIFGDDAVVRVFKGVPLAFALDQESSLTRTPATHARTLFYGARREYREAAVNWHQQVDVSSFRLPSSGRPFPIPTIMRASGREEIKSYDLIVIADFNLNGGAYVSTMNYVEAALRLGKTVALFQWRRADLDVTAPLKEGLRERAWRGDFDVLAAGERVQARCVLVGYPVVLNYALDAVPSIDTDCFAILVNQMASRLITGEDPQYDPRRIAANVRDLFGIDPTWVPISGLVRRLMQKDTRYPKPYQEVWSPLLDVERWLPHRVKWRGLERERPVIGRHARDHYTKWPAQPQALAAAYCVGRPCEVQLLGGADHALRVLGQTPENWRVLAFAESSFEFLKGLDFFVHYPHEDYIEEFGRAVLEAMGLGIPVILPPVFRETFGEFAHYAEPEGVWPLVDALWRDEQAYSAASELGLAFVGQYATYDVLQQRLKNLIGQGVND